MNSEMIFDSPKATLWVGPEFSQRFFFFYVPVGQGIAFDGEIAEIRATLSQLHCNLDKFPTTVILCDSKAVLLAIVSNNNPLIQDILDCRLHLQSMASLEKNITLQWVPTYCGVPGNKNEDYLDQKGALIKQNTSHALSFCAIRHLAKKSIKARAQKNFTDLVSHDSEEYHPKVV
ncbi:hypothetical protein CDAR_319021 [Caerostris darwini]|uniref:RNase H type-1 domain-containing protein n=1 Tax=Caerostris darwini TaxID=1538125 RepID=A0AAV4TWE0_9ARAC|nr:hypothetical protein CDAR_319021 [Caerostris darwini]